MDLTRREFLGVTAAAALPLPLRPPASAPAPTKPRWLVLPVPGECTIEESALGYRHALPREQMHWGLGDWRNRSGFALLIVPAVLDIPSDVARVIEACLRGGTTVIVESGAGFAGRLNFRRHRRALRELLHVDVQAPVELWPDQPKTRDLPYVEYSWPHPTKVRDFSRVVPVEGQAGEVIARVDGLPVGLRRRCGNGTLVFLGSPLGPALWAGDTEARQWLSRLFSL